MSDIFHVIRTGFYCFALSWNTCNLQSQLNQAFIRQITWGYDNSLYGFHNKGAL